MSYLKTSFQRVLTVTIISILFLGIVDIIGIPIWNTESVNLYGKIFWTFAYSIAIAISIVYYILAKDKSEAIAIFITFLILLKFGLQDLSFYIFKNILQGVQIDASMPHLYEHWSIGGVAKIMGLSTVTPISLVVSVSVGIGITYFVVKWLKGI